MLIINQSTNTCHFVAKSLYLNNVSHFMNAILQNSSVTLIKAISLRNLVNEDLRHDSRYLNC